MKTLLELLPEMERLGDREAVLFATSYRTWKWSYDDLRRHIRGVARKLQELELQPGDRILLWGENRPEWIAVFWGALARGLTLVPIDFRSTPSFVERVQREVKARLLVHGASVETTALELPRLSFEAVKEMESDDGDAPFEATPDAVVQILYTSGTTGEPKGVVHRHRNLVANLAPIRGEIHKYRRYARPFQPVRFLDLLPMSHVFGQFTGLFVPVVLGGAVAFMEEVHPSAIIETIRRERISILTAVPRFLSSIRAELERRYELETLPPPKGAGLWAGLARWWRNRDVHSALGWKFWAVLSGGARLPSSDEEFWWRLGFVVVQGYGLTETSSLVATNHPFHPKRGALGKAVGDQRIRLAEDGEILVRGDNVSLEYFGREAPDADAWLHTGDIGELGEDGTLYYRGRKKDVIVGADGLNVYPADVEAVLNRQPEVKEAVVVAQPTESGDVVYAVLLLAEGNAEDAITRSNADLEPHQRVRAWSVWPEEDFPRTKSTFKVLRGEILARLERPVEQESASTTRELLARQLRRDASDIGESQRLSEELGLTSLDRVELLTRLEEYAGHELSESDIVNVSTVKELEEWISSSPEAPRGKPETSPLEGLARHARTAPIRFLRAVFRETVIRPLFRHYLPLSVEGDLRQVSSPVIFAANHQSNLDTLAILTALPFRWRGLVAPAVQQEYFSAYLDRSGTLLEKVHFAIQYWLAIVLVNVFPLARSSTGTRESLRFAGALADEGYSILIYPEGRLTRDGKIESFKAGVGLLAMELRVPVVPVHLDGLYEVMSVYERWPKRGAVRVRFGSPLRFHERADSKEVTRRIESAVRKLAGR